MCFFKTPGQKKNSLVCENSDINKNFSHFEIATSSKSTEITV